LALAIAKTLDHQSQESTDCRWLKLMALAALDRLRFASDLAYHYEELDGYPNVGDMRHVRPFIRATEMMMRHGFAADKVRATWNDEFWEECWEKSECILLNPDEDATEIDRPKFFEHLREIDNEIASHFISTMKTTGTDPRHDGAFGLVFYIFQLALVSVKTLIGKTIQGRIVLRSAVEAYITLCFLVKKDDPTIWLQYRNYGSGQAKLAYLKQLDLTEAPSFITAELLETFANEDMWMEHQDIKLGAWADRNLRKMAEDAGIKSFYDAHYDALSGYVHANWAAVRHSAFTLCANPLHRLHRIPIPLRILNEDALPDLAKICNLALDQLSAVYPTFKPRVKWREVESSIPSGDKTEGAPAE
jgi:hypothetical protein